MDESENGSRRWTDLELADLQLKCLLGFGGYLGHLS